MKLNTSLHKAKDVKNDEFYTKIEDVERELVNYMDHFKGKHIFMNCDDPESSNFWRFFAINFHRLGLKQITSTHCNPNGGSSYRMDMYKEVPKEALDKETFITLEELYIDMPLGYITRLEGDGDFRSEESIEILKEVDIVVTNPPFSLFRVYVKTLIDNDKKFIIIGSQNAISYKEIFTLLKNGLMWVGVNSGSMEFEVPNNDINKAKSGYRFDVENNKSYLKLGNINWFTNLDHFKRHEELILYKTYNKDEYPAYYNFEGIEVSKVSNIPYDYECVMGVPITFLSKFNPNQFEIVGLGISNSGLECGVRPYTEEHRKYRKEVQKRGAANGDLYMIVDGKVKVPYARILIKKKSGGAIMKIELHEIPVRDLVSGYNDDGESGVTGYNGKLDIRPPYQREFVYQDK